MGKPSINEPFSMAMLVYQRVCHDMGGSINGDGDTPKWTIYIGKSD